MYESISRMDRFEYKSPQPAPESMFVSNFAQNDALARQPLFQPTGRGGKAPKRKHYVFMFVECGKPLHEMRTTKPLVVPFNSYEDARQQVLDYLQSYIDTCGIMFRRVPTSGIEVYSSNEPSHGENPLAAKFLNVATMWGPTIVIGPPVIDDRGR